MSRAGAARCCSMPEDLDCSAVAMAGVRWRFVVVAVALGLVGVAIAYVGAMALLQRRILFPRPTVSGAPARPQDALQVWLPTPAGQVEAWYLPPTGASFAPAPAIMFFHGNGELIDFWPAEFAEPRRWGVGVLLVEYPGYGRSSGEPTEETITRAALAAYDWTQTRATIDAHRIIVYGRSLGGGAAAILAARRRTAALLLESTFTSVRSFAHDFWAPELIVRDPFDTLAVPGAYEGAVLILHGERDELVPVHHAEALARAARHSELELVPCGHNDCPAPWPRVRRFLVERGIIGN